MLDMEQLAGFALASFKHRQVPPGVMERAKIRFIDGIACLYDGCAQPQGMLAKQFLHRRQGHGSTLIAGGLQVAPESAAWAHGLMIHAIDWDDWTYTLMHPTAAVLPAVLAVAEYQRLPVADMLHAYVVAVEAMLRFARAVNPELYMRGWHPSSTISAIGSAVGAGLLLGHNETQLGYDVSLALCQSAGMFGNKGTMGKPFQVGNTCRAGVMSALAVTDGFDGAGNILDAKFGFTDTFLAGVAVRSPAWHSNDWEIMREWPIKLYPVGGSRQSLIHATIGAIRKWSPPQSAQIAEINCTVNKVVAHMDHANPVSWLDSRFSHAYCAAVAAIDGAAGPQQFGAERFGVGDVQRLMARVTVRIGEHLSGDPTTGFPSHVEIVASDGRRAAEECSSAIGGTASMSDSRNKLELVLAGDQAKAARVLGMLNDDCGVGELVEAMVIGT